MTQSTVFSRLLLLAVCLLLAGRAFGDKAFNIVGQVRIGGGEYPNHRVEVRLESRGMVVATTFADQEGSFSFSDLTPNVYHIIIDDPEFQPWQKQVAFADVVMQNLMVQVFLVRKEAAVASQPSDGVASGNPYLVDQNGLRHEYSKEALKAFRLGLKRQNEGKLPEAAEFFKKAVTLAPQFYQARNNLGGIYLNLQRFLEAEEEFQEVIKSQQADAAAFFNLGNVYLVTNRPVESLAKIQEGLQREPNSAKGQYLLGTLYSRQGRVAEAQRYLRAALENDPTMSKVHLELVNLYLRQKMMPEATAELKIFLERFPADPLAPKARDVLARLNGGPTK